MSTPAKNHMDFPDRMFALGTEYNLKVGDLLWNDWADWADYENRDIDPTALGGKRSWVPVLGEIVWEFINPDVEEKKHERAAIYRMQRIDARTILSEERLHAVNPGIFEGIDQLVGRG